MKWILVLLLALAAIAPSVGQTQVGFALTSPQLYELYSWPESKGVWNFSLLPSPSGINIPTETIFDKTSRIAGTKELQRKLSLLPAGTRIIWLSGLASGQIPNKKSRKLALPPWQMVENIKNYARQHHIQMEVPRSTPD